MNIRKTRFEDLGALLEIYEEARSFMRNNGNPKQWGDAHPAKAILENDITKGISYVLEDSGAILAVFCFFVGHEPSYDKIEGGAWLNDKPYGVIHRIASSGKVKGSGVFCINWCLEQCGNLRIDTHRDNAPMQSALKKTGFVYCGIINVPTASHTERLAFQKCLI